MATLSVTKNYADGTVLFESDLDAIASSIETFLNVTGINDDNIQDSGITASTKLVNASITEGKLGTDSVTTTKIANAAVTTPKIEDDAVTTAKILDAAVTSAKIANDAVGTAQLAADSVVNATIANDAVDTDQIATGAVTQAKMANRANGGSSASAGEIAVGSLGQTTNSDSFQSAGSVTITTTGRPVLVFIQGDGSDNSRISTSAPGADAASTIQIRRGSTQIMSSTLRQSVYMPASFQVLDFPGAGTYTYDVRVKLDAGVGGSVIVADCNLVAYEI